MAEGGEENRTVAIREIESRVKPLIPINFNTIPNTGPQNEELRTFVINCSQLFKELYDSLQKMFTEEDLRRFDRICSLQNTSTHRLLNDISELSENRKILNDTLKSCASKLDNSHLSTTIGRLFVSLLELINNFDSASDNSFSKYLIKESYHHSYKLGFMTHIFFGCVSMSSYLSFIPECWDVFYSQWISRDLVKASQQDMMSLERVKTSFGEIEEMDEQVKELFLHGMDGSIVKTIDRIYRDCDQCTKVFAVVFFSSLESNHSIISDVKLLGEMFFLSRMEIGKEWYNRALTLNHPVNFIMKKLDCRKKLTALAKSGPEISIDLVKIFPNIEISTTQSSDSKDVEKKIFKLSLKPLPHFILGTINIFSIYSSYKKLMHGEKHLYSDSLRILSEKATLSLMQIEKFRNNINNARFASLDKP